MENRRQRYGPGSPIKNQNFVIDVKFDITELDLMCAYIVSENRNIHRGNIINMRNLFLTMNMNNYSGDQERLARIDFIMKGIDARLGSVDVLSAFDDVNPPIPSGVIQASAPPVIITSS